MDNTTRPKVILNKEKGVDGFPESQKKTNIEQRRRERGNPKTLAAPVQEVSKYEKIMFEQSSRASEADIVSPLIDSGLNMSQI